VLWLPNIQLEVVKDGDTRHSMIDCLAAAPALAKDLVVFESGDGVFCGGPAFAEPFVGAVFDDAAVRTAAWAAVRSLPR